MVSVRLLFFVLVIGCLAAGAQDYALRGTLIAPGGIVENGTVLVQGGKIAGIGAQVQIPRNVTVIDTHAIIAPGLIDLHNHLTWNVFPRWHPTEEFGSRYDWQQKPVYQTLIESPHAAMLRDGMECAMERYAEVKALSEGETSVVGSENAPCSAGLARNLDTEETYRVAYNVFPLQIPEGELAGLRTRLASRDLHALLIHLAEGSPHNASSAREFTMLRARGLLVPGVALIHGVALTPENFKEMAAQGVAFIWSPRSNLELYGDTANVAAAKAAGVRIALAPDWSPTGSDGLLAELNYAAAWADTQTPRPFTDRELVAIATSVAAEIVGQQERLGSLEIGQDADLLVLSPDPAAANHDAYWSLTHADASQVALVTVAGAPLYGDPALLKQLAPHSELLAVCGVKKALVLSGAHGRADAADVTWADTTAALDRALRHHGRMLAPLAECGQ
jgi:5-methylthioadenosine/S-adenosylhomocysteine deaminase